LQESGQCEDDGVECYPSEYDVTKLSKFLVGKDAKVECENRYLAETKDHDIKDLVPKE